MIVVVSKDGAHAFLDGCDRLWLRCGCFFTHGPKVLRTIEQIEHAEAFWPPRALLEYSSANHPSLSLNNQRHLNVGEVHGLGRDSVRLANLVVLSPGKNPSWKHCDVL
jgi:hypothetical protein